MVVEAVTAAAVVVAVVAVAVVVVVVAAVVTVEEVLSCCDSGGHGHGVWRWQQRWWRWHHGAGRKMAWVNAAPLSVWTPI